MPDRYLGEVSGLVSPKEMLRNGGRSKGKACTAHKQAVQWQNDLISRARSHSMA